MSSVKKASEGISVLGAVVVIGAGLGVILDVGSGVGDGSRVGLGVDVSAADVSVGGRAGTRVGAG